jgi:hypothetical protein
MSKNSSSGKSIICARYTKKQNMKILHCALRPTKIPNKQKVTFTPV